MNTQRIPIDRARKPRYVFAAILLFAGVTMLWVKPSHDPSDHAWGWLFFIGGALFLTYRNYVEIDPASKRLALRSGFLYGFRFKNFDTEGLSRITLKSVQKSDGKHGSTTRYRLIVNKGEQTLHDFEDMLLARRIAERISRALRVDFDNHNFGVSSLRSANELDMSLAERWRLRGETKVAPRLGPDSKLVLTIDGDTATLSAPNRPISWMYLIVVLLVIGAALTWFGSVDETSRLIAWVVGAGVLALTLYYLSGRIGPNVLRVSPSSVEHRWGHSPVRRSLSMAGIEELIISDDGMYLVSDADYLVIGVSEDEHERQLQIQFLEHQIATHQPAST